MKNKLLLGIGFAALLSMLHGQDKIGYTRDVLEQWVETRQIISQTKSNWSLEKSILQNSEALLTSELERLNRDLEDLDATATAADEVRMELAAKKDALSNGAGVVEDQIGALETKMKSIVQTLPAPLVERIKPLTRRLPEDPDDTKANLGERVQNIVGILSQVDKFNGTLTQTSESREVEDGRVVEVRTLYWGLGGAFYVDAAGEYAGVGVPGAKGWEWLQVEGAGPQIKRLLGVYEGTEDIQFVEIPASIK